MSRYSVQRQTWDAYCEHEKCAVLHIHPRFAKAVDGWGRRFHVVVRTEWIIIDAETGERAKDNWLCDAYDTRRNAVAGLRWYEAHCPEGGAA